MNNSKLTFKDLDIVEIEDVDKLFEKLSPWDKVEFIKTHIYKENLYSAISELFDLMPADDQDRFYKKIVNAIDYFE